MLKISFVIAFLVSLLAGRMAQAQIEGGECFFPPDQFGLSLLQPVLAPESSRSLTGSNLLEILSNYSEARAKLERYGFEDIPLDEASPLRDRASGVVRVDVLLRKGDRSYICTCSGVLVRADVVLTARHCLNREDEELLDIGVMAGFERENVDAPFVGAKLLFVPVDQSLDVAALQLETPFAGDYRVHYLAFTEQIRGNHGFEIIGHPVGLVKRLVRSNCRSVAIQMVWGVTVRHLCATLPGMSGAPIFDANTGQIVAIHTAGGLSTGGGWNSGISMVQLLQDGQFLALFNASGTSASPEIPKDVTANDLADLALRFASLPHLRAEISFNSILAASVPPGKLAEILEGTNAILADRANGACPLEFVHAKEDFSYSEDSLRQFESGISDIGDAASFQAVTRLPGMIKLVQNINWCGTWIPGVVECSSFGSPSSVIEVSALLRSGNRPATLLLHALGHQAGLSHNPEQGNFMNPTSSASGQRVDRAQCLQLYQAARVNSG